MRSTIKVSPNVKRVIAVPNLLATTTPGISQLREMAVRLQADVLIVYSVTSDIYYKYRVFNKNEAKAFATCEAIVFDTRTGVIPHTTVVTKDKLVVKEREDMSDFETRKKAEREAVILALAETGKAIADFLAKQ
jgi:hypothetical protein